MTHAQMSASTDSRLRCLSACCNATSHGLGRRSFLHALGGSVLFGSMAMLPGGVTRAASGHFEAMVLSCIDPRFQDLVSQQQARDGLGGRYSAFTIAGAAIGVVAPAFKTWHQTFWENLAASVQLHHIKKVIVVNHRDCGAARIAYGEDMVATPAAETATHQTALLEFRKQLKERHPHLGVQLGLMSLNGQLEQFG